jgi:hypothetical protein
MRPDPIRAAYSANMYEVTRILNALDEGDPRAAEQLLQLVVAEFTREGWEWLNPNSHFLVLHPHMAASTTNRVEESAPPDLPF